MALSPLYPHSECHDAGTTLEASIRAEGNTSTDRTTETFPWLNTKSGTSENLSRSLTETTGNCKGSSYHIGAAGSNPEADYPQDTRLQPLSNTRISPMVHGHKNIPCAITVHKDDLMRQQRGFILNSHVLPSTQWPFFIPLFLAIAEG